MKAIFNADILYDKGLVIDNVAEKLRAFLQACADKGHVIVIPLTALLEFNSQNCCLVAGREGKIAITERKVFHDHT